MNTLFRRVLLFGTLLLIGLAAGVSAQGQSDTPPAVKPADVRANALRQLGLTREQMMEIRKINQARKPQMQQAQDRLRAANRALNESIYADTVNETEFQAKLREFHAAQAEVARIRFVNEMAVRRVLTTEQVGRFRQIRDRFEQGRQAADIAAPPRRRLSMPKLKRGVPVLNK